MCMSLTEKNKTHNLMHSFCQDKAHLEHLLYVENIDSFCIYQESFGFFEILNNKKFSTFVLDFLEKATDRDITPGLVENVIKLIKLKIYRHREDIISDYVALDDKLLNLSTFEYEEFSVHKAAFHRIHVSSIDVLSQTGHTPLFFKFLDTVLVDENGKPDQDLYLLTQETIGYLLLNTIEAHTMFFLVGGGQNGKSVLLNILKEIIGKQFVSSMSIEFLTTDRFGKSALVGKKVNICNEEESKYIRSDTFKALVSGDPVQTQRKFGESFVMYPTTKYIFATNNNPKFESIDDGLMRRIIIIPFNKKISEEEKDTKLTQKLLTELPGIIGWALEGAKRLVANGFRFTQSSVAANKKIEFEKNLSSALYFISEEYEETDNEKDFLCYDDLYLEYTRWCVRVGRKSQNQTNFLKDIKRVLRKDSLVRHVSEINKSKRGRLLRRKEDV